MCASLPDPPKKIPPPSQKIVPTSMGPGPEEVPTPDRTVNWGPCGCLSGGCPGQCEPGPQQMEWFFNQDLELQSTGVAGNYF
ncbi:Hypothetical protein FKW44_013964 [Caligus rogercresseyi]|uniref:Uncharacterized protein n=1 Tax=Caligus rogercresseyi TaxID=217165 RepID=A0A7T8GYW0_CALRO|nr:Hypothetical protein FKW44_013964 [Caligus rogercresseyi]